MLCLLPLLGVLATAMASGTVSTMSTPHFGDRTLVILEDEQLKTSHSKFFAQLEAQGHKLRFATADERGALVTLRVFGEFMFDNLIVFAPSVEKFGTIDVAAVVEFVDEGQGNVLLAGDFETSDTVRDISAECGVEIDEPGTAVIDHMNFDLSDPMQDHTRVLSSAYVDNEMFVGDLKRSSDPIMYSGAAMAVSDDNILAVKVLTGESTAYSAFLGEEVGDYPQSAGSDSLLVAAIQTRNNARIVVSGSLDLFSNRFFDADVRRFGTKAGSEAGKTSNEKFCAELAQWNFRQRGVLRASGVTFTKPDGSLPATQLKHKDHVELPPTLFPEPEISRDNFVYRIKDKVLYHVKLEEYTGGRYVPLLKDDVQLEFVMLDPYIRTTMTHDDNGVYRAEFLTPDVYGIYKFHVSYRRHGYTTLNFDTQVSVRPFKHDEFERFIVSAYPYYSSVFSMMGGVFVFSFLFLYSREAKKQQ